MNYYISDTHLGHKNIIKLDEQSGGRHFGSIEEHDNLIIENWNKTVKQSDKVYILGDFSWMNGHDTEEILRKLNGVKFLIKGNHDRYLKESEFNKERFVWIKPYAEMHDNRRKVVLSHYPIFCYNGQYRRNKKGEPLTYMLYGHVHDTLDEQLVRQFCQITRQTKKQGKYDEEPLPIPCNMLNCFCMYSDYIPRTLDEWIDYYSLGEDRRK